jgi:hypothetical protein
MKLSMEVPMPEQLTKHPDVTLQVLRSAGAQCGAGAPQEILSTCSAARFCKLPGGELCVYGLNEAAHMTQISAGEWQAVLHTAASPGSPASSSSAAPGGVMSPGLALLSGLGLVLIGVAIGWMLRRR